VEGRTASARSDPADRGPEEKLFRHTHARYLRSGPEILCDLHWTIGEHLLLGPDDDPTSLFWSRARPFEIAGVSALALSPSDQLLHVILHGAQPGSESRLQWIADAVMILRSAEIDPERIEDLAIRFRATIRISDALSYLADPFVPDEVPRRSIARLRAHPVSRSERFEYALASHDLVRRGGMFPTRRLATYIRETRGWTLARRVRLFPRFLQEVWELERLAEVPGTAIRKVAATLRGKHPSDPQP
jgi:hypothetical protein